MNKKITTKTSIETISLGRKIGEKLTPGTVLLLDGDLSAGKTTLTKGIGEALGIKRIINSPTFNIMKEYEGKYPLYHLDLYRLHGLNNDYEFFDYIDGNGVCVIEWPNQVPELLPKEYLKLNMKIIGTNREIELIPVGEFYERLVGELDV